MPLYDYRCPKCNTVAEVRHGFDETYSEPCPSCGGPLVRVFNPAPIVFKGSGFYATDSRKSSGASKTESPAPEKPAEKPAAGGDSSKTSDSAA
ncbi:MAG TPA: FmdB family zinc ribbon protein [Candidatus Acidoferrales bacterium]|nr:FmdB family zinc ribbon protein [Candidatus Acidoferrales bacterium]